MTDTQWPRFMVFQQTGEDEPLMHNGTVHAPDVEMALMNARDVFVRRPDAVALWVVPVDAIYSQTREVLANQTGGEPGAGRTNKPEDYIVFGKLSEQAQATYLGKLRANSAQAAMNAAVEKFSDHNVLRWWVFPTRVALKSSAKDSDPMFAPARDKTYKDQAEYPVVTMMRQIRATGHLEEDK